MIVGGGIGGRTGEAGLWDAIQNSSYSGMLLSGFLVLGFGFCFPFPKLPRVFVRFVPLGFSDVLVFPS